MSNSELSAKLRLGALVAATSAAFAVAGTAQAAAPAAHHAAPTRGAAGLSGIWLLDQHTYDIGQDLYPPFLPSVKAAADAGYKQVKEGGKVVSDVQRLCLPIGMPGMVINEFALKFLETPGEITVVSENSPLVRTIYLNGKHEEGQDPSWNGDSVGHWEGKTLVVDTVNLNDRTPHIAWVRGVVSLTTHITERYHVENNGQVLINDMTFEDPKLLTKPWTVTYKYYRAKPDVKLWEYVCEPNAPGWSERYKGDPEFNASKQPAAK